MTARPEAILSIPPLQGCLYCHHVGTVRYAEGRKVLGLGSGLPTATCSHCGTVAQLEIEDGDDPYWRIRYKKLNSAPEYYYVMVYLGEQRWIDGEEAMEISRRGFVQRHRIDQVQHGDLEWLEPAPLNPPPPLMSPYETVYLAVPDVSLWQPSSQNGGSGGSALDVGTFYVTDRRMHLVGQQRDWSNRLAEIRSIEHDENAWRIFIGGNRQYFTGSNTLESLDAQLFTAIVKALWKREE
ncbi:MAG: hypothetical protein U0528_04295 [Anaerolineae bacterium]|nr:hypothetical protein [Anaerolineae bacterium]